MATNALNSDLCSQISQTQNILKVSSLFGRAIGQLACPTNKLVLISKNTCNLQHHHLDHTYCTNPIAIVGETSEYEFQPIEDWEKQHGFCNADFPTQQFRMEVFVQREKDKPYRSNYSYADLSARRCPRRCLSVGPTCTPHEQFLRWYKDFQPNMDNYERRFSDDEDEPPRFVNNPYLPELYEWEDFRSRYLDYNDQLSCMNNSALERMAFCLPVRSANLRILAQQIRNHPVKHLGTIFKTPDDFHWSQHDSYWVSIIINTSYGTSIPMTFSTYGRSRIIPLVEELYLACVRFNIFPGDNRHQKSSIIRWIVDMFSWTAKTPILYQGQSFPMAMVVRDMYHLWRIVNYHTRHQDVMEMVQSTNMDMKTTNGTNLVYVPMRVSVIVWNIKKQEFLLPVVIQTNRFDRRLILLEDIYHTLNRHQVSKCITLKQVLNEPILVHNVVRTTHAQDQPVVEMFSSFIDSSVIGRVSVDTSAAIQSKVEDTTQHVKSEINKSTKKFDTVLDQAKETLKKADGNLDRISEILNQLTTTLAETSVAGVFILHIGKIISFAYLVSLEQNQNARCITALVTLIAPTSVGSFAAASTQNLIRAVTGMIEGLKKPFQDPCPDIKMEQGQPNIVGQMEKRHSKLVSEGRGKDLLKDLTHLPVVTDLPTVEAEGEKQEPSSIIYAFYDLIKGVATGMLSGIDAERMKQLTANASKVRLLCDVVKSIKCIFTAILTIIEKILEWIQEGVAKIYGTLPKFMRDDSLVEMIDEFVDLKLHDGFKNAENSVSTASRVIELRKRLVHFQSEVNKGLISKPKTCLVMPYVVSMIQALDSSYNMIPPHVRDEACLGRERPFSVWTYGLPGGGKSATVQEVIQDAIARECGIIKEYQHPSTYTYYRDPAIEYWEKYNNQPFVQYDDFLQVYADSQALYKTLREYTNINGDSIMPLDMAFDRKGAAYFTSKVIMVNSQKDIIGASWLQGQLLSGGSHIYRRRHVVIEIVLNPKYALESGAGLDVEKFQKEMEANPDNIYGADLFPRDAYNLIFHCPMTGQILATYNFEEGVVEVVRQAKQHFARNNELKKKLEATMRQYWSAPRILTGDPTKDKPKIDYTIVKQMNNNNNGHTTDQMNGPPSQWPKKKHQHYGYGQTEMISSLEHLADKVTDTIGERMMSARASTPSVESEVDENDLIEIGRGVRIEPMYGHVSAGWECRCITRLTNLCTLGLFTEPVIVGFAKYLSSHRICPETQEQFLTYAYQYQDLHHEPEKNEDPMLHSWADKAKRAYRDWQDYMRKIYESTPVMVAFAMLRSFVAVAIIATPIYLGVRAVKATTEYGISKVKKVFSRKKPLSENSDSDESIDMEVDDPTVETHEGKNRVKKRIIRIKRRNLRQQMGRIEGYQQNNRDIECFIRPQFCVISTEITHMGVTKIDQIRGSALCIGSDVFVMPRHYWHRFEDLQRVYTTTDTKFNLILRWSNMHETKVYFDSIHTWVPTEDHLVDVIFFRIKNIICMKNLKKHFVSINDSLMNFTGSYMYGIRVSTITDKSPFFETTMVSLTHPRLKSRKYYCPEGHESIYGTELPEHIYEVPNCLVYNDALTTPGDCGMVLMHIDDRISRKIFGIHTGAWHSINEGYGAPIYAEDIQAAYDYFEKFSDLVFMAHEDKFLSYDPVVSTPMAEFCQESGLRVLGTLKPAIINGKKVKLRVCLPNQTKISQSVVFDAMEEDFGPHLTEPAILHRYRDEDGQWQSPMCTSLKKLAPYSTMIEGSTMDKIREHMIDSILSWNSLSLQDRRLLTEYETINGMLSLNPLDLTTSPGFPFTINNTGRGKSNWFTQKKKEDGTYYNEMLPSLRKLVEEREQDAVNGLITETYFIATLKDETRPLEKTTKPRIFQVGPMDLSILMRKYFGVFVSHFHSTFIDGEAAIGVNATSKEWHGKIKMMKAVADYFLNGDYKWYDATLAHQFCCLMIDVANAFYRDGKINARVREVLIKTCLNTKQLIENFVVMIMQGNPSGIILTTILNIIVNMAFIRYAYLKLVDDSLHDFFRYVCPWFYGDDNLIAIAEAISKLLNMRTYRDCLAKIGVTYTSADKKEITKDLIPLEECSFLKRNFAVDKSMGIHVGQLDQVVINEICRWSESNPTNMVDQMNRFNSALKEQSQYYQSSFTEMRNHFREYCHDLREVGYDISATDLFSYEYCRYMMYPDYYHKSKEYTASQNLWDRPVVEMFNGDLEAGEARVPALNDLENEMVRLVRRFIRSIEPVVRSIKRETEALVFNESALVREFVRLILRYMFRSSILNSITHDVINYDAISLDTPSISNTEPVDTEYDGIIEIFGGALENGDLDVVSPQTAQTISELGIVDRGREIRCYCHPRGHLCDAICKAACDKKRQAQTSITFLCPVCSCSVNGEVPWKQHVGGNAHLKRLKIWKYKYPDYEDPEFPQMPPKEETTTISSFIVTAHDMDDYTSKIKWEIETMPFEEYQKKIPRYKIESLPLEYVDDEPQIVPPVVTSISRSIEQLDDDEFHESKLELSPMTSYHESTSDDDGDGIVFPDLKTKDQYNRYSQLVGKNTAVLDWLYFNSEQGIKNLHDPTYVMGNVLRFRRAFGIEVQIPEVESQHMRPGRLGNTKKLPRFYDGPRVEMSMEEDQIITTTVQKISTFEDSNEEHDANNRTVFYHWHDFMPSVDLPVFLSRPFVIFEDTFNSSDSFKQLKFTLQFPSCLRTLSQINSKLYNVAFWRPNFKISIRMNGSPMHYGALVVRWLPRASTLPAAYKSFAQAFQRNWIQVDANAQQVYSFEVPFILNRGVELVAVNTELFTVYCYVSIPLNVIKDAAAPVGYTVLANIIEPDLRGYLHNQYGTESQASAFLPDNTGIVEMWSSLGVVGEDRYKIIDDNPTHVWDSNYRKNEPRVEMGDEETAPIAEDAAATKKGGMVSSLINAGASWVASFVRIPVVGFFAKPVAGTMRFGATLLKWAGLSVPRNLSPVSYMVHKQTRVLRTHDLTNSQVLDINEESSVVRDFRLVNGDIADMDILTLSMEPCLLYVGQVNSTMTAGSLLYSIYLTPRNYVYSDWMTPATESNYVGTYAQFFSRYAYYWRGSTRFWITFKNSPFHSLRLRVSFVPYSTTTPGLLDTANLINQTYDITQQKEFGFTCPWYQIVDMRPTGVRPFGVTSSLESAGVLYIHIFNILCSGETPVNPVFFQIFVSMASDFQLFVPDLSNINKIGVPLAQSLDDFPRVEVFDTSECELPSSSHTCLQKQTYPVLGGHESAHRTNHILASNEITGVRQLCNMLSRLWTGTFATNTGITVSSGAMNLMSTSSSYYSYLKHMRTLFRYERGSVRYAIMTDNPYTTMSVDREQVYSTANFFTEVGTDGGRNIFGTPGGFFTQASLWFSQISSNPIDFTIPYYSIFQSRYINNLSTSTDPQDLTLAHLMLYNQSNTNGSYSSSQCVIWHAAGDDYIMGFVLPVMQTTSFFFEEEESTDNPTTISPPPETTTVEVSSTTAGGDRRRREIEDQTAEPREVPVPGRQMASSRELPTTVSSNVQQNVLLARLQRMRGN
jgi:hypothetical protein